MKEYSSCQAAIDACISQQYFSVSHLYNDDKPMSMHIHDCYEIYYSVCGGKQFLIDNRSYSIQDGDIFFIDAVSFGIAPHIPHGARRIESAHFLRIRAQAIADHKALITERRKPFRNVVSLGAHTAEPKCASGADENRSLNIALCGITFDIRNEVVVITAGLPVALVISGNIALVP